MHNFSEKYTEVRLRTEAICKPLHTEDYVVQPVIDVSPPKWHLGHTTWFWETFLLKPFLLNYQEYKTGFNYVFNSYYETVGARVIRTDRGNLSRPTVDEIYAYRKYVDEAMHKLLQLQVDEQISELLLLGLNHEEQHQELLFSDIKYILGHNPLFPPYHEQKNFPLKSAFNNNFITIEEGIYQIGYVGKGFCFDNELNPHKMYLPAYEASASLVNNEDYLEFIKAGGYQNFKYWHADGWDWVNKNEINAPLYWYFIDGEWYNYTLAGLQPVNLSAAVNHVSFYEASAFANWQGKRLLTEAEWEVASYKFSWGERWEWTNSAYLPYPGFKRAEGAIGEYNGKFMVNQMVLRGASELTPPGHSRNTYRNFFHPHLRWQYTGIRLAINNGE
jgi:ergothioneine biosynthesis protein EgtB